MEFLKRNLAVALALGILAYLVLALLSGSREVLGALARFEWTLLPVPLALVAASYAVRYARWSYYLRLLGVRLTGRENVSIFAAGLSMTISPGKLGEALKSVLILRASGDPVARTAPAVVAERATDGVGMVAWGVLGSLAFGSGWAALGVFLGVTVVGVLALRSERLSRLVAGVLEHVPGLRRLAPKAADFHGSSKRLFSPGALAVGIVLSIGAWGLELLAVYLSVTQLGARASFLEVVLAFAVSSLLGAVTPLPGGIGAVEAGLTGMLRAVAGLPEAQAAAATLVIRLVTL